jgi:protein-disulfide isomerase
MSKRSPRSASTLTIGSLTLALALIGACGSEGGEAAPVAEADSTSATPPEPQVVDLASLGYNEGNAESALFGVVEFADFGCIHCYEFHTGSYPALHDEFVASGDVLWKYIPITIGGFPNGRLAGLSGVCGGMLGQFNAMRDRLFEAREEWLASDRGEALFVEYARAAGLDGDAFSACLGGQQAASTLDANDQMARTIGVTGTPTFIVRGIPVRGAPPLAEFQTALRQLVVEVRAEIAASAAPN